MLGTIAAALVLALLSHLFSSGDDSGSSSSRAASASSSSSVVASNGTPSCLPPEMLPTQARTTLHLIDDNGPFPYDRDGIVFGNYEGLLPEESRGYYHEYTVPTPGESDRGARRIIAGSAGEEFYTADHYGSFTLICSS